MSENVNPIISIIIPAYNEEKYLPEGLTAIKTAMKRVTFAVEVIVVDNGSTDRTSQIAKDWGAKVVYESVHKIARVRNTGVKSACGEIILTVDADSKMHPNTLKTVYELMQNEEIIGGSVRVILNEKSLKAFIAVLLLRIIVHGLMQLGGGIYFCRKRDFDAIGGFNEELYAAEDLDFAAKLKSLGKKQNKKYLKEIKSIPLTTSARKLHLVQKFDLLKLIIRLILSPRRLIREKDAWKILFYGDNLR